MRPLVSLVAGLSLLAGQALAAIGNPVSIGTQYTTSGTNSNTITTGTDAAVGAFIVVPTAYGGTTTITSVADNAATPNCSGAYTANASAQAGSFRMAAYYCNNTGFDLPIGGTIKTTFVGTTGKMSEMAFTISGLASSSPVDATATASTNGATTTSVGAFTVTPGSVSSEIMIACVWITGGATGDSYTEDTGHGWTAITPVAGSSSNILEHCAYQKTTATTALTWAPTWTNNRSYSAISTGFKASGGAAATPQGLSTMGIGWLIAPQRSPMVRGIGF